jgi:hypothetical protein
VSNSKHSVLYSEQRHIIHYGNVTNWNSSGCYETSHPVGMYCVKCLTNSVTVRCTLYCIFNEQWSLLMLYTHYISVDNEIYCVFHCSLKTRLNESLKIQSIFHTLSVYNKFNPIQIFTRILYGRPHNCSWFLWQLWRLCLAAQRSLLYNNVLKEIIKMIWTVCIEGMGGWRNSRKCMFVT